MKKYIVDYDGIYSTIRKATKRETELELAVTFSMAKKELNDYAKNRKFEWQMLIDSISTVKKNDIK